MLSSVDIAALKGGRTYQLTYDRADILYSTRFDSSNWGEGISDNLSSVSQLTADSVDGGTWIGSVPIGALTTTTAGAHLTYSGSGVTMEYSTDGTTWTAVNNKTTVLEDVDVTGDVLQVRLTLADDTSYVDYLLVDILNSRTVTPYSGSGDLTFLHGALDQTPNSQLDLDDDSGIQLRGGYLDLDPNDVAGTIEAVQTIEGWFKFDEATGWVIGATGSNYVSYSAGSITAVGATMYRDGVPFANGATPQGEWHHWVFVLTSPVDLYIRVGNKKDGTDPLDMTVAHVATYGTALSAAEVSSLYAVQLALPSLRVDDASVITVTESVPAVDIYAYNWTNRGS